MFEIPFYFQDCVHLGNDVWFASGDYNGLYRYNLKEKRTERIAVFQYEPFLQCGLFLKMCQYKNNLIFVPQCSKRIYIFNTNSMIFTDIKIPNLTDNLKFPYFCEAVVYEKYLYMMGAKYPGILKVHLEDYTVEIIDQWIQELRNEIRLDMNGIFLGMKGVLENNKFLIPCYQCNRVLEFNMDTNKCRFYEVGNRKNKYTRLIKVRNTFALITHDYKNVCSIVLCSSMEDNSREIKLNIEAYADREIIEYLGDIWVLSLVSNEIYRLRVSDGEISNYAVPDLAKLEIVFAKVIENELFFCDYCTQSWYKIDCLGEINTVRVHIKDCITFEEIKQMLVNDELPDNYIREYSSYPFEIWINKVAKCVMKEKCNRSQNTGKLIYESLG